MNLEEKQEKLEDEIRENKLELQKCSCEICGLLLSSKDTYKTLDKELMTLSEIYSGYYNRIKLLIKQLEKVNELLETDSLKEYEDEF